MHRLDTADSNRSSRLLSLGALAGPLYVVVGLLQVLVRDGFDIRRHALSLLSNGDLGWIQIASFILSGVLTILGAIGLRRAWGSFAAPILLAIYGIGLIGAGIFVADPMDGFPIGTPPGPPATISTHGPLHFVAGAVGFIGLIAATLVVAFRFWRRRESGWTAWSLFTGLFFLASFVAIASGRRHPAINLGFTAAVVVSWIWVSALFRRVRSEPAGA